MEGIALRKIRILFNYIRREWNNKAKEFGFSGFQCRILHILYLRSSNNIETVQKDLEKLFNSSKSGMCEILIAMQNNELIERVDSSKSRAKQIVLTKKGLDIHEKTSSIGLELEKVVTQNITKEEFEVFLKVMNTMISNLGGEDFND